MSFYCTYMETVGEHMGTNQQIEGKYDSQLMDGDSPKYAKDSKTPA